jgi:phenylalanyl-tRNA synthetase beta subunit
METGPFANSKYALAISLTYQSSERTLTDDEVENLDKAILITLRQRLGAELRQ